MDIMAEDEMLVTLGVDTHRDTHVIAALDLWVPETPSWPVHSRVPVPGA